jgi:hypothetical protein
VQDLHWLSIEWVMQVLQWYGVSFNFKVNCTDPRAVYPMPMDAADATEMLCVSLGLLAATRILLFGKGRGGAITRRAERAAAVTAKNAPPAANQVRTCSGSAPGLSRRGAIDSV